MNLPDSSGRFFYAVSVENTEELGRLAIPALLICQPVYQEGYPDLQGLRNLQMQLQAGMTCVSLRDAKVCGCCVF
jgi:hypothetical protein